MSIEPQKCRAASCDVQVFMLRHRTTGNYAPIEVLASKEGNIAIDMQSGTYIILTKESLTQARDRGHELRTNHFATCKFAKRFRPQPKPTPPATAKSEISRERRLEILQSLASQKCEGCGGHKRPQQSHCRPCYFSLPQELRAALYLRFGDGYEEAFEESLRMLRGRTAAA